KTFYVKTVLTTSPVQASMFINDGGVVAFPTETVYGLGANVFNKDALGRIFEAKQRPPDNPLIVHIGKIEQLNELTVELPETAKKLIRSFFPGPLTVVLKKSDRVPYIATAGLDTVGVRMPRNGMAGEFLAACGVPVAAPSANLSGRPSPTTWQAVLEDLDGRIDCILQGEATVIGLESTVVDCTGERPELLRTGAIPIEELKKILPNIVEFSEGEGNASRSPGLRHRHYSPKAKVVLFHPNADATDYGSSAFIGINSPKINFRLQKICSSTDEYARSVFEFFRECDRQELNRIYCETVLTEGIGTALMDRLHRAAEDL
ncbi:MAG: L-threonylcarbamoyladenylate synthase, partial [Blastocatellia bacterium]